MVQDKQGKDVKDLLESDEKLLKYAHQQVNSQIADLSRTVQLLRIMRALTSKMPKQSRSMSILYTMAMAGKLKGSPLFRELLLFLRRAPSDMILNIMAEVQSGLANLEPSMAKTVESLVQLLESTENTGLPLRSEHDVRNETLRTTVVAKKIELSKQKSELSKADAAYSKALMDFVNAFEECAERILKNPQDMVFKEAFIYDIKGPTRATFAPKTRAAVERALSSPHDYLNCDCCHAMGENGESQVSSLIVPSVLADRYKECLVRNTASYCHLVPALLGVRCRHQCERPLLSILCHPGGKRGGGRPHEVSPSRLLFGFYELTLFRALFQRSLAELKHLGLIKSSRKKIDHVAKAAWIGL